MISRSFGVGLFAALVVSVGIANLSAPPSPTVKTYSAYELSLRPDGVMVVVDVRQRGNHHVDITNKTDRLAMNRPVAPLGLRPNGEPEEEAEYHEEDQKDDGLAAIARNFPPAR